MKAQIYKIALYIMIGLFLGLTVSLIIKMTATVNTGVMPIFIYGILMTGRLISNMQKLTTKIRKEVLLSLIITLLLSIAAFIIGFYPAI